MTIENGKFWEKSWNPIRVKGGGYFCTKISPGCANCWSEAFNLRFGNSLLFDNRQVEFVLDQRILEQPLHWKKPRIVAVQWLGDLFHKQIPDIFITYIWLEMSMNPQHTFLVLTKRPERMSQWCYNIQHLSIMDIKPIGLFADSFWPIPNLWLGVSVSTQQEADEKIPILLQTPAKHRFVNFEPLLEAVRPWDHSPDDCPTWYDGCNCQEGIDWVLVGAESGPGRRPMKLEWARNIVDQCKAAGVPLWIKQIEVGRDINPRPNKHGDVTWDVVTRVSHDMNEFPESLRVRQWPW